MNIFRYYHQNRKLIWFVIMAIIILIIALQTINGIVENRKHNQERNANTVHEEDYKNNLNINVLLSEESVKEEENLIIDQFIRYCNAGKIQEAYKILTEDCKEELFPTIDSFKQNYYNLYFLTTKLYSKENLLGLTYKVKLYDDMLETGSISNNIIEDYYTIEKQEDGIKLNIGHYIGAKKINRTKNEDILKMTILKKQVYQDYEKYEIEITNLTYQTILLDRKENTRSMYLIGENNVKYYALSHEVLREDLILQPKATKVISIKYNKEYNSNQTVKQLVFSDLIENYELYQEKSKQNESMDGRTVIVNL